MPRYAWLHRGFLPFFCEICRDATAHRVADVVITARQGWFRGVRVPYCREFCCTRCGVRLSANAELAQLRGAAVPPEDPRAALREAFGDEHHQVRRLEVELNREAGLESQEARDRMIWTPYALAAHESTMPRPGRARSGEDVTFSGVAACVVGVGALFPPAFLLPLFGELGPAYMGLYWVLAAAAVVCLGLIARREAERRRERARSGRDRAARIRMEDRLAAALAPLEPTARELEWAQSVAKDHGLTSADVEPLRLLKTIQAARATPDPRVAPPSQDASPRPSPAPNDPA